MEELLTQIGNFGFPMVISIYLLVRFEGKIQSLTESIYQLAKVIEMMK
ncbi:YvrJ family protein [Garciella nitratireducens]|uniref:YvrJ protein family protein n=1 Tax=Garciella nitratireducens DSM 15102 TaxID=1121911 RepID=A0A1T4LUN1_9FIRM|nr:YvrJ family protein [Garciella nitratireducens]RBP44177.1 YvrJ-like protein [Garciella nitratireducens]SJZ58402.1 YvrJ protein family protein [Garciella nitratireducens DSM 15102]